MGGFLYRVLSGPQASIRFHVFPDVFQLPQYLLGAHPMRIQLIYINADPVQLVTAIRVARSMSDGQPIFMTAVNQNWRMNGRVVAFHPEICAVSMLVESELEVRS